MTLRFLRGLARRTSDEHAHFLRIGRLYRAALEPVTTITPLAVLHDQLGRPSCLPQAYSQGIEPITSRRVSAVKWHEGARTLQGTAGVADVGTRSAFVLGWADRHGWADYEPGEDARPEAFDVDGRVYDDPGEAMQAARRRHRLLLHQVIDPTQSVDALRRQVVAALATPSTFVVLEGGTRPALDDPPDNTVLDTRYRGGNDHGHAERIAWYDANRDAFGIQGSWGGWTHCYLPDGRKAVGCYLLAAKALPDQWAFDVVGVVP